MASILDLCTSSDSEDDDDYIPSEDRAPSESSGGEDNTSEDELEALKSVQSTEGEEITKSPNGNGHKIPKVDPKKRADDIWASFLNEVEITSSSKPCTLTSSDETEIVSSSATIPVESASKALKEPTANVFEFAGETFTIDNDLKPASNLEKANVAETSAPTEMKATQGLSKKRGGIDSVLGTLLNKKQKMTTLQKTMHDWKSFKKDEGIEEDLEKFNKGRGGFIERQRFLQRSDVRSFEAEKSIRQSRKKK